MTTEMTQHRPPARAPLPRNHPGNGERDALSRAELRLAREALVNTATTLVNLNTSVDGLTDAEAEQRLEDIGPNEVAHEKAPHWSLQLLSTFKNPFIIVLLCLGAVEFATNPGELKGVIIISAMIAISVLLRFTQEFRSIRAAEKLRAMVSTTATVSRRRAKGSPGVKREVPIQEVVPGDIVHLSAGDMIPADLRLIASRDLFVSQAILTGESIPVEKYDTLGAVVEKSSGAAAAASGNPLEYSNLCFMGTNVVSGTATGVAAATGSRTYFGSLAKSIVGQRAQTSFDRGVNSVSWVLIRFMLVMVPVVLLINGFTKGDWLQAFLFAVSVAVGLTPEMLPMIVSANLAKGALTMAKNKVVIKRLNAIQNFGAMDVLCTDKTGTLTQDKIILERHLDVHGNDDEEVLKLGYLNSYHQTGLKNLLDVAVLKHVEVHEALQLPRHYKKVDELPFDFVRRRMTVVVEGIHREHLLICKGAVEEMLSISTRLAVGPLVVPLDDAERERLRAMDADLNEDGFRVIAVATKEFPRGETRAQYAIADESGLVLRGFLAFLDPPKETAVEAIRALQSHGVAIKILTGDTPVIARKVCREVGLEVGVPLLGQDIEALDNGQLREQAERTVLFAKMSPLQKARVIKALQASQHTVGFLGDGINDAPALRDADVGISVDTAADIAKESADIILLEKSLMVLERGVLEGRMTFGNIIKYIKMTASSNFGNVFSVLIASAFLPFLPMLALQLLVQNLFYDISQLSIPFDRMDEEYLERPRKWQARDIARFMVFIGPVSSVFDMVTFGVMWFAFRANAPEHQSLFQSGWFIEGLLSQTLIVHMIRTRKIPFIQSVASLPVVLLTLAIVAAGICLPFSPVGTRIGLQALPLAYFPWLAAILLSYCVLTQLIKVGYIRRFGTWL